MSTVPELGSIFLGKRYVGRFNFFRDFWFVFGRGWIRFFFRCGFNSLQYKNILTRINESERKVRARKNSVRKNM